MQDFMVLEPFKLLAKSFRRYFFNLLYASVLYYLELFSIVNISDYSFRRNDSLV